MTPIERIFAAARFEPLDCVPVAGAVTDFYMEEITPGLDGLGEKERLLRMLEYGAGIFPEIPLIFVVNPTPALYSELWRRVLEKAGGGPVGTEHMAAVSIPDPDSVEENVNRLSDILWFIENIPGELKSKYGCCRGLIRFENPFDSIAQFMGGTEWFMRIASDPGFVEAAMDLFTEASVTGAKWLAEKIGAPEWVILAEDYPGFVKRADFERFVVPYHRRILGTFPGAVKLLHNDSNTTHLLDAMPECGMDIFHFGYEVDVRAAKDAMRGRVALMGNLAPMTVLARAPEAEVERECERIIEAGKEGGGFIFSTGGEVNPGTDPSRLNLMVEFARKYGGY